MCFETVLSELRGDGRFGGDFRQCRVSLKSRSLQIIWILSAKPNLTLAIMLHSTPVKKDGPVRPLPP